MEAVMCNPVVLLSSVELTCPSAPSTAVLQIIKFRLESFLSPTAFRHIFMCGSQ